MAAHDDLFESAGIRPEGVIQDVRVDYDTALGRGSDATVYGGTWQAPQANVAVKMLHPLLTEPQAGGREIFLRKYGDECNRLQNLRHDNIVKFIGVTRSREGTPALVTERMDTTLRDCSRTTELSLLEQLDILCDASAGLTYLHSRGVVHRDLTTRNVLLSAPPNRRAKLADVGLSRSLHGNWWFFNFGAALTRCPGTMSYMPPEALSDRPTYDERLDSFSFGVLMMAVVLRRDPSTSSLHAARERILPDGRSEVIPEAERRAPDVDAIGADHPLLDLIKQCLENDPKRRPSARAIHENLHGIRTRLFPTAQRKPETDYCLDCQRSNQEVVRLNTEVASVWSRLEHQIQTSAGKDSTIQALRAQLREAEDTVTTMRGHEQDLHTRLTEVEDTLMVKCEVEEDLRILRIRLTEAEDALMVKRGQQEATELHARKLEQEILCERERSSKLKQALSEIEESMSTLFLKEVRQYNRDLEQARTSWFPVKVNSPFGQWKTVDTNLPGDVYSRSHAAVHGNFLYVTLHTQSSGVVLYRSMDKTQWEKVATPPDVHWCCGLLSYNNHLISLFHLEKRCDPHEHPVLFRLLTEDNDEKTTSWEPLPNGQCPNAQQFPAVFVIEDKLMLAGGQTDSGDSTSDVSEYCLETNQWITPSSWPCLPKPIKSIHAVCLGDCLHLFGGQIVVNKVVTSDNSMVFSVKMENGTPHGEFKINSVPESPHRLCSACRVFSHALVAGGHNKGPVDGVSLLDDTSKVWLKMPSLNVARYHCSLVVFNKGILCIGGYSKISSGWCSTVEELSVSVKV